MKRTLLAPTTTLAVGVARPCALGDGSAWLVNSQVPAIVMAHTTPRRLWRPPT
jgi:hypothetical protein